MTRLRRSYGKVSTKATGVLYLLFFRERRGTDKWRIQASSRTAVTRMMTSRRGGSDLRSNRI
jgi:hypothetical protein